MCKKLWNSSKRALCFIPKRSSDIAHVHAMLLRVKCPLVVGCVAVHPLVTLPWDASSRRCPAADRAAEVAVAGKSEASSVLGISWRKANSFPAEWACCSALPMCEEFRWEGKRVFLLAGGFLTTINLGVWAISIMFPPIAVSLAGKCSGHTVCKAEFMVTLAGGGRFVWSQNNLLWF